MPLLGFSLGSSDAGGVEKSLDDIIADRRKEQAKAASGRKTSAGTRNSARNKANDKKNAIADRSMATGRAKRAAANRARRGLSNNGDKKPTAMEVEKEVYRQSRKTATSKKQAEKKASSGRVAPNSTLRDKKKNKNANAKKTNNNDAPGVLVGKIPNAKQIQAAIDGMKAARCPVPKGYQLVMQFAPIPTQQNGKGKGKQQNANKNNNSNKNQKTGGRRQNGRGRNN